MVKVTRRDGTEVYVNPDLIAFIEETPDTHITLINGSAYIVLEPATLVIERIVEFKATILSQVSTTRSNNLSDGFLHDKDKI
jgi:flagellar protein FlbD